MAQNRLLIKITRENLPQVRERFPFIYLEHGRLNVDDSSVKWLSADGQVIRLPVAMLNSILLGPGTSVTHEAIKVLASANCLIAWVGDEGLIYFATGQTPTANSTNFRHQFNMAADPDSRLDVAKRMFRQRFPDMDLSEVTLQDLMGKEGMRVKQLYEEMANRYKVGWKGRVYTPGRFELSDATNQILTTLNAMLYGIVSSTVHSLGFSPYIGFVHTGSPLPFVYDIADLYKADLTIDLAFDLTLKLAGRYDRQRVKSGFIERAIKMKVMERMPRDIKKVLGA